MHNYNYDNNEYILSYEISDKFLVVHYTNNKDKMYSLDHEQEIIDKMNEQAQTIIKDKKIYINKLLTGISVCLMTSLLTINYINYYLLTSVCPAHIILTSGGLMISILSGLAVKDEVNDINEINKLNLFINNRQNIQAKQNEQKEEVTTLNNIQNISKHELNEIVNDKPKVLVKKIRRM